MTRGVCTVCGELVAITPGEVIPPPPGAHAPTSARYWILAPHEIVDSATGRDGGIIVMVRCAGSSTRI